ncbi:MAG: hypothetical protein JSU74_01750 [Candidatus Zixiibacteriota bacterium]|nr:MAG: hypothetical protein JSU74_01750 [candidate division Zixibacteria bacterium]
MSENLIRIGIDSRGDLYYVARVEQQPGRHEVKALIRLEQEHLGQHHLLTGGELVLSIPDELVMIKKLRISGDDEVDLKARFEMVQALPDDESQYLFDIIRSGLEGHFVGLAARRDRLADYKARVESIGNGAAAGSRCKMRAAALAMGYTGFCRKSGGDLVCLADFQPSSVSLVFLYQGAVVDLAYLRPGTHDPSSTGAFEKIAMELRTLVNFKTAGLFSDGITTPLSCMIVSGDHVTDEAISLLRKSFSIDINRPLINTGFFSGQSDLTSVPLEKYLVALGLAAN